MNRQLNGLMRQLRRQDWYQLASRFCDENELDWSIVPARGRSHPKLKVIYRGRKFSTPVPTTERGRGEHHYIVKRIERFIRATDEELG